MNEPVKLKILPPDHSGPVAWEQSAEQVPWPIPPTPGPTLTLTPGGHARMALWRGVLYMADPGRANNLTAADHDRAAALGHLFEGEAGEWPFREVKPGLHIDLSILNPPPTLKDLLPPESREEMLRQLSPTSAADGLRLYVARCLFGWHLEVITHTCPDMLTVKAFDGQAFRIVRVSEQTLMDVQLGGMGVASVGARIVEALRSLAGGKGTTI